MPPGRLWRAVGAGALCLGSTSAYASGPYVVDDAAIGDLGQCQVESWVSAAGNGDLIGVVQPACVVWAGAPVELRTTLEPTRHDAIWTLLGALQAKFIVVPYGAGNIAVALAAGAIVDARTGDSLAYVNIPVTLKVADGFRVNLNAGGIADFGADPSRLTWGAGGEWDVVKAWTLIVEVFGETGDRDDPRMQAGLRYAPAENTDIDIIYGHNIAGEHASWLTVGLTVRF